LPLETGIAVSGIPRRLGHGHGWHPRSAQKPPSRSCRRWSLARSRRVGALSFYAIEGGRTWR